VTTIGIGFGRDKSSLIILSASYWATYKKLSFKAIPVGLDKPEIKRVDVGLDSVISIKDTLSSWE
jgi:hypothetical protein